MHIKKTDVFTKWFDRLKDRRAKIIINQRIVRISDGLLGDFKSIGEGVGEIRVNYGPGYRIYCTIRGMELIILLCGGEKSTQQEDIKKAKSLAKEI